MRQLKFKIEKNIPHWLRSGDVPAKDTFAHIEFSAGKSKADNHTWLEIDAEEGYMSRYNKPVAKRVMLTLNLAQLKELRALLDDMIKDA